MLNRYQCCKCISSRYVLFCVGVQYDKECYLCQIVGVLLVVVGVLLVVVDVLLVVVYQEDKKYLDIRIRVQMDI